MPQPRGTPTVLDGYETIKKLGQGTYGLVFLCRARVSGKQCVMRMQLGTLSERERRSLQEARCFASFSIRTSLHTSICTLRVQALPDDAVLRWWRPGQRLAACKNLGR